MNAIAADSALALTPGTWTVDEEQTRVGFAVRHLAVATVRGRFTRFHGRLDVAEDGSARGGGSVEVASVDTGEPIRDNRLVGPDCFDAQRHPRIELRGARLDRDRDGLCLVGDLTICGVTRPVRLGVTPGHLPNRDAIALRLTGVVRRSDFGLRWSRALEAGGAVVSDRVALELDVVLRRAA
jgi:polyisoprenoid-binding protein YceI